MLLSISFRLCVGLCLLVPSLAYAAYLDIPGNGSTLSGIGVISGWKCEATAITVVIDDGTPIPMLHGSERGDTRGACGDTNNGFLAIFNYALLDDGEHTAVAYDNGEEFARSTFEVGTLGEEFVRGARAEVRVENFPSPGESTLLVWNEASQHFEVAPENDGDNQSPGTGPPPAPENIDSVEIGGSVRVNWDSSPGATHYEVWRCTSSDTPIDCQDGIFFERANWSRVASRVTGTTYLDTNLPSSDGFILYYAYVVQACNRSGCSGLFSSDDGGSAAAAAAGACRAGLVVNPGESCTYQGHTFSVSASGRGSIAFFSSGNLIDARGSTINGVRWNFYASKNSGSNSWTIHTAD